jgi:hypothetical protein
MLLAALLFGALALSATAGAAALAAPPALTPAPGAKHLKPVRLQPAAKVKVGAVSLGKTPSGKPVLLAAIRYPIQASGREIKATLKVAQPKGPGFKSVVSEPASAGVLRQPERRRAFTFVHEFDLPPSVAGAFARAEAEGHRPRVTVEAESALDVDGDGRPDISSHDSAARALPLTPPRPPRRQLAGEAPFCASIPRIRLMPGQRIPVELPACERKVDWKVRAQPAAGSAKIVGNNLFVRAPATAGPQELRLSAGPPVSVTVTSPDESSVRAIGDSVTAGYGYYSNGSQMPIYRLPECKPFGAHLNDACSSNSTSTFETGKEEPVPYAPDYGLANDVSWAAQWANAYGVTDYENLAVTGSEPKNWAPEGSLYETTKQVEAEDPDYILMTMGANPILSETLFGFDPMACAIYADIFGEYSRCVEKAFAKVNLRAELKRLYTDLVEKTHSTIYLMQYHLSIPSSALAYTSSQIAQMVVLMNNAIAGVAAEVNPQRLRVIAPPHFNAGLNLEPVYAAPYECGDLLTDHVDGPSVQSTLTQAELHLFHPAEFCPQRVGEKPWVISGDTGIHPSAEGYFHMASALPAPN